MKLFIFGTTKPYEYIAPRSFDHPPKWQQIADNVLIFAAIFFAVVVLGYAVNQRIGRKNHKAMRRAESARLTVIEDGKSIKENLISHGVNLDSLLFFADLIERDFVFKYRAVVDAVKWEHLHILNALIAVGLNVNIWGPYGNRPIHFAAIHDKADHLKALMEAGANVEAVNMYGDRAIHFAAHYSLNCLQVLIAAGAAVDTETIDYALGRIGMEEGAISRSVVLLEGGAIPSEMTLISRASRFSDPPLMISAIASGAWKRRWAAVQHYMLKSPHIHR
jgi:hypothetical protein